jgi:hypothetical protein
VTYLWTGQEAGMTILDASDLQPEDLLSRTPSLSSVDRLSSVSGLLGLIGSVRRSGGGVDSPW